MADLKEWERDLGNGVRLAFVTWAPERDINPQYADADEWPDTDRYGASIYFPDGCGGAITFEGPVSLKHNEAARAAGRREQPLWTVESWDPLTISPSVLDHGSNGCSGHHGYIRNGRWEDC